MGDRVFILNDLEKLEADTHAFSELSDSLKQKLKNKEKQIEKLRQDLNDFTDRLKKQERELADLTTEDAEGAAAGEGTGGGEAEGVENTKQPENGEKATEGAEEEYTNGRGENVVIR